MAGNDPFAEFGGSAIDESQATAGASQQASDDPFAAFGGKQIPDAAAELPDGLDGLSPNSPAAGASAVDLVDRFKLALGNEKGNVEFLQSKFGKDAVQKNQKGDLVIKDKDGLWKAVDPNTLESPDAWTWTQRLKEGVAEVAENIPTAVRIGSGLAKTTGAAALGGIAGDLTLSSMGRAFGTYSGDTTQQLKEALFEGTLNAVGVKIADGVKPTLKWAANTGLFKKVAEGMASMTDDNLSLLKTVYQKTADIAPESVDAVVKNADQLDAIIAKKVGRQVDFEDALRLENGAYVAEAGKSLRKAITKIGGGLFDGVADDIAEGSIRVSPKDLIDPELTKLAEQNLLKIKGLSLSESKKLLAEQGGKLLPEQSWEMLTQKQLLTNAKFNPNLEESIGRAATDTDAYKSLAGAIDKMVSIRDFATPKGTKEQVKRLIEVNRQIRNITLDAREAASATPIANKFAEIGEGFSQRIKAVLPESAAKKFTQANAAYSEMLDMSSTLLKAGKEGPTSQLANTIANAITSKGAGGTLNRTAFDRAIQVVAEKGGQGYAAQLKDLQQKVLLNKAAMEFTRPMRSVLSPLQGGAVAGLGASLASGNPLPAIGAAATLAASSPAVGLKLVRGQLKANALVRQGVGLAKTAAERAAFVNKAMPLVIQSAIQSQQLADSTTQQLLQGQDPNQQ